ncbi:MAG: Hsp70 family protein [Desulfobulbaceae bacterium]|nr:Hsp70 family protein [Desulfobulbaceae bacterium]
MQSQHAIIPAKSKGNPQLSAFGIDLGTTNSAIATLAWNPLLRSTIKAECLTIRQTLPDGSAISSDIVPSVVALKQNDLLIGTGAKWLKSRKGYVPGQNIFSECKNDIGVRRTYHEAPPGFRTAPEVSSTILEFLMQQATGLPGPWGQRVVVTVPASFSTAQRRETISAAQMAGLSCHEGMLLDEPVAAFIDYIITNEERLNLVPGEEKRLLVFDFGGGTSDVAIFTITGQGEGSPMQIAPLAVSRYYQIGGGDIDRAIAHRVLIPQIIAQNSLDRYTLSYQVKKRLEAPLAELAEFLKIHLCNRIMALPEHGADPEADEMTVTMEEQFFFQAGKQELQLSNPCLTMDDFKEVLRSFLDQDLLYAKENEYVKSNSIVAPLRNSLEQCRLSLEEIDFILMVGGSSLIPQVSDLMEEIFPVSEILTYEDPALMAGAVARGAAYQALSLLQYGKGIVETVCGDRILVRTDTNGVELIPKGASLPYPAEGFAACQSLALPETSLAGSTVRVEIEGGNGRLLFSSSWTIDQPVRRGESLLLEYRMDADQVLHLRLSGGDRELPEFNCLIEHPLTAVHNNNDRKNRMLELEEELRLGKFTQDEEPDKLLELARHCTALDQNEKALGLMSSALSKKGPDVDILNFMGICCDNLGDTGRAMKLYREAAQVPPHTSPPLFNLALSLRQNGHHEESLRTLDEAIARYPDLPYYVLRAELLEKLGRPEAEKKAALEKAIGGMTKLLTDLNSWDMHWLRKGARMQGDDDLLKRLDAEEKRRDTGEAEERQGMLPIIRQDLVVFGQVEEKCNESCSATILLVDDAPVMLSTLLIMLPPYELQDHCFITASDGEVALEILRAGEVDLVCTNLNMPRMNGFKLMEHLRDEFPNIPYMAYDNNDFPGMEKRALKQGAYAYLDEPRLIPAFAATIKLGLLQIGKLSEKPKPDSYVSLAEYLSASPPADDGYWDDVWCGMEMAMDLRDGTFSILTEGDPEKHIAYYLRNTAWGEEVWAKLRRERPELFHKPGLPPSLKKAP